jgi:hypothetical protein
MMWIQRFVEELVLTMLTVLRIIFMSGFIIRNKKNVNPSGECAILGNGPSLTRSIKEHPSSIENIDLICVNFFPETDLYGQLKPKYFITSAPEMWIKDVSPMWEERRIALFNTIVAQTDWDIIFMIPVLAKRTKFWRANLSRNSHIKISYYNITPIEGFRWFKHFCFRNNLGTPRAHNVLTPAIMQMLNLGYKKIWLLGADHSWLPEITVDDQNRVLIRQRHFYDYESAKSLQMGNIKMGVRKLHEVLHKFYHTFAGYFMIKEYAESINAKIINVTPGSFIDAFERGDLK